jgi:hypothetical protein
VTHLVTLGDRALARTEGLAVLRDYANWWEFDPEDPICPVCAGEIADSGASAATGLRQ